MLYRYSVTITYIEIYMLLHSRHIISNLSKICCTYVFVIVSYPYTISESMLPSMPSTFANFSYLQLLINHINHINGGSWTCPISTKQNKYCIQLHTLHSGVLVIFLPFALTRGKKETKPKLGWGKDSIQVTGIQHPVPCQLSHLAPSMHILNFLN